MSEDQQSQSVDYKTDPFQDGIEFMDYLLVINIYLRSQYN